MSPSGGPHGSATSRISFYVSGLVYGEDLGETFAAETGFLRGTRPGHDPGARLRVCVP